ncbi:hypothetical protein L210DRAFT_3629747 [Boletus edulis BED1]|uniref:Uncharacterized protein n=1 Tax=Boletus edulis BED1 TaxID=1328754 RepID=A0AAD4BZP5_BOLED|nr:hypothetical protein L210DRAFT_3629747 [Boletus edulis BED1]
MGCNWLVGATIDLSRLTCAVPTLTTMSGLENGKYLIVFAAASAPPPMPVGANESGAISPVIVGGRDNVWTVFQLPNGNYTLILEQTGPRWLSQPGEDGVFVGLMPLPGEWRINGLGDNTYSIEVPSPYWPTRAWYLDSPVPGTKVLLRVSDFPAKWNFIRVDD